MIITLLAACGESELRDEGDIETTVQGLRHGTRIQVKDLSSGEEIWPSVARLSRRFDRVKVRGWTTALPSAFDVTLIWAIFNHPEACTEGNPVTGAPCGPADLANDAVGGHVSAFGDRTTNRWGKLRFRDRLWVGDVDRCIDGLPCRDGLTNPYGAEVHIVLLDPADGASLQGAQFIP